MLLLWFGRLYRLHCRSLARLIKLEFSSQLLNQGGNFFLPLRFDLLSQPSFHFSTFLNVARFELSALLRCQLKARIANRCVGLAPDSLASQILTLPQDVALCRTHSQPALGVSLEILACLWRHRHQALTCALSAGAPWRSTCRSARCSSCRSARRSGCGVTPLPM